MIKETKGVAALTRIDDGFDSSPRHRLPNSGTLLAP